MTLEKIPIPIAKKLIVEDIGEENIAIFKDRKARGMMKQKIWKRPDGKLIYPFSGESTHQAFPIEIGKYKVSVKKHFNSEMLQKEFSNLLQAYSMGISVEPLGIIMKGNEGYLYTKINKGLIPLDKLKIENLKPSEKELLFKKIGETLAQWHHKNLFHGDSAPKNLLVEMKDNPKILGVDLETTKIKKPETEEERIKLEKKDLDHLKLKLKQQGALEEDLEKLQKAYENKKSTLALNYKTK